MEMRQGSLCDVHGTLTSAPFLARSLHRAASPRTEEHPSQNKEQVSLAASLWFHRAELLGTSTIATRVGTCANFPT